MVSESLWRPSSIISTPSFFNAAFGTAASTCRSLRTVRKMAGKRYFEKWRGKDTIHLLPHSRHNINIMSILHRLHRHRRFTSPWPWRAPILASSLSSLHTHHIFPRMSSACHLRHRVAWLEFVTTKIAQNMGVENNSWTCSATSCLVHPTIHLE